MKKLNLLLLLCFSFLLVYPELLDPKAKNQYELLKKIADKLHSLGIDVIQDWNSEIETKGRPVVAPLNNYYTKTIMKSDYQKSKWEENFQDDVLRYSLGIRSDENIVDAKSIKTEWDKIDVSNRVFISYASEDENEAEKIKTALEAEGFQVFTYLGNNVFTSQNIAKFMCTAGHCLVLDTKNSRTKGGVIEEALAYQSYKQALYNKNLKTKKKVYNRIKSEIPSYKELCNNAKYYLENNGTINPSEKDIQEFLLNEMGIVDETFYNKTVEAKLISECYYKADDFIETQRKTKEGINIDKIVKHIHQQQGICGCAAYL